LRTHVDCLERRSKPRIQSPFPATVRGVNARGEAFETDTVLDNLSASGLYLFLRQRVEQGAKVFIVVQFSTSPTVRDTRPRVALRGEVLRTDRESSGACGIAVAFTGQRFL
jgi:hypothetical protein